MAAAILSFGALCIVSSIVPGSGIAYAQNTNATIRGQVMDPTGALIPGAHITIVNKATNVTVFNGESDSVGAFVAPQVIPGTYKISASGPGMRDTIIDNLVATVAQTTSVNINMEIGGATDVVTVEAKGEQIDRSTSDVSTLISPQDVQLIPLQQRTTENMLAFIPGVTHGGAANTPSTSQLSINGSRTLNTEVLLNGVSTIVASTGSPLTLPSPDGVDSFRALTTNAPAEYGRTSGAVISVNTISGTNAYHGNVYFLARNEALDANQYFHKTTIVNGAPLKRNRDRFFQAGGSLGGPVRIPHFYNGIDKTFFFINYDRTTAPNSQLLTLTVPTAAQRTGDFSNALAAVDALGNPRKAQSIYRPGSTTSAAFSGNQLAGIDPAAAKILALLPLPNTPGTYDPVNNRYTGNWTSLQNLTSHTQKIVGRVDEQVTSKDRVALNVYRYITQSPNALYWNSPLLNSTWDCSCSNAWLPSIDYTRVWNPTLVMDLNMGFFRNAVYRNPPGAGMGASQKLGIASLPVDQMPQIIIGGSSSSATNGISNMGADTNTNQVNITNTYSPFGSITKTIGAHTLKVGASLRKNEFNSYNPASSPEGSITFDGSITNHGASGNANTQIADFMLGQIKTASYEQPQPPTGRRNSNFGVFAQDDWKVSSRLTMNVGLRYEYEAALTIATDIYSRIDPNTGKLLAAGLNGASRSLNIVTPKADFSPRVGLAYSVNNKTVLRGAFGTFYGTIFQNLGGQLAYPGYDTTVSYNNLGTGVAQPFSLSQGIPAGPAPDLKNPYAVVNAATDSNPYGVGVSFNDQSRMSLVKQWNAGIQRQLPFNLTLEANYVGNRASHLAYGINKNVVPLSAVDTVTLANTTKATQDALLYPTLKSFSTTDNVGRSGYDALQVSVRRQFNTQFALFSNYSFAVAKDDGSTIYNFSAPNGTANAQYTVDAASRAMDYTYGGIDVRHTLNIALQYTSKGPWWMRDWHISPVFVGHTGLPINITQTAEIPSSSQRPNGDSSKLKLAQPVRVTGAMQYFDSPQTDANFALTPSGPVYNTINGVRTRIVQTGFGNVARNSNRAPGEMDLDASVSKDFKIWERVKFQVRVDAFNLMNHTNFQAPNGTLAVTADPANPTQATFATSSSFGKITGTQPNRQMQASTRFFF
jgi:hypothetical protein